MKKRHFFIIGAAALLVVSTAAFPQGSGTQPKLTSAVPAILDFTAPTTGSNLASVLFTQPGNGIADGYVTQNFEAAYDAYDSYIADDFTLAQQSCAKKVTAVGFDSGVSPSTGNVRIYENTTSGGGTFNNPLEPPVCEYMNVTNTGGGGPYGGDMVLDFSSKGGCCLTAGVKYWISVQANMPFTSGQFFWVSSTPVTWTMGNWKNPGGAFGTACVDYGEHCAQCSGMCPEGPRNWGLTLEGDLDCNNCTGGGGGTGNCDLAPIEAKLDAAEVKLDAAEGKLDALDTLEGKADAAESKLDAIESKLDVTMSGINAIESKLDVLESKYDAGGGGEGDGSNSGTECKDSREGKVKSKKFLFVVCAKTQGKAEKKAKETALLLVMDNVKKECAKTLECAGQQDACKTTLKDNCLQKEKVEAFKANANCAEPTGACKTDEDEPGMFWTCPGKADYTFSCNCVCG